ncbi:MAG: hypothetical protein ACFBSE_03590 [Prochloraceae cyanobacterium]
MAQIAYRSNLIGGIKGGVGKSTFSSVLLYMYEQYGVNYQLIDADTNNPNVAKLNKKGLTDIKFAVEDDATALSSNALSNTDKLLDLAMESDLIINLPSDVEKKLIYWFEKTHLLEEDITENQVRFTYWFLSGGSYDSITLFLKLLEKLSGPILDWVFVRNKKLCTDWSRVENRSEFIEAKKKYNVADIEFPGLPAVERDFLEEHQITYDDALNKKLMPLCPRQRLRDFLKEAEKNITNLDVLPLLKKKRDPNYQPPTNGHGSKQINEQYFVGTSNNSQSTQTKTKDPLSTDNLRASGDSNALLIDLAESPRQQSTQTEKNDLEAENSTQTEENGLKPENTTHTEENDLEPENTTQTEENDLEHENTTHTEENALEPENTTHTEENDLEPENTTHTELIPDTDIDPDKSNMDAAKKQKPKGFGPQKN